MNRPYGISFVKIRPDTLAMTPTPATGSPLYIKLPLTLLGLVLATYILSELADILIPLAFAMLIAILLNPLYVRMEKKIPKVPAIIFSILLAIFFIIGLFYFLSTQIAGFVDKVPLIQKKVNTLMTYADQWTNNHFGINLKKQIASIDSGGSSLVRNTLGTIIGTLSVVVLIPIYVFMMLFYKPLILDFLFNIFSEKHSLRVAEILSETKAAVQSFMQGLMIETAIVCTLNSVALLFIGVPSAVVIGVIGGLLNLLPYIGGLVAIALPVLMLTITREGYSAQLLVIASYLVIQFIDNNILVPRIVSKKVQINALISIIIVLLGGALWGIAGMFLSIPFIGVIKIIFDRIDELKPWGKLLGDEVPTEHVGMVWQKRWDRIFRTMQKKKAILEQQNAETE
ncbi:MAG: AI-2E family transporter [Flavisolibacter sp.]